MLMKKILIFITFIFISNSLFSQSKRELDSLNMVVDTTKQDTAKVMALVRISFYESDPPKRFQLVNKALVLTRKIKFEKGEAQCLQQLGNHFSRIADYPEALEYYIKSLKIREQLKDNDGISAAKASIGNVYISQQNYKTGLVYFFEATEALKKVVSPGPSRWPNLYAFIAGAYYQQNILDSALLYYNRSYESAISMSSRFQLGSSLTGLGNVHAEMGNSDLAFSFYKKSIANAIEIKNVSNECLTYIALSKLFSKTGNRDSAIFYASRALTICQDKQFKRQIVDAARQLSLLYEETNDKEALRYYKLAMDVKDSIFNASNTAQIQSMTFSEDERQREINEAKLKDATERRHNLQYAGIAIAIISFVILFFALSRSIVVKTKFIEFFGVLGLLAVFEFINLFIHPYLAHATNDSPVLMLVVLIAIAALLIPLHHKLQHWITGIMVEKNKKIRLAAAKKTIAKLEGEQNN